MCQVQKRITWWTVTQHACFGEMLASTVQLKSKKKKVPRIGYFSWRIHVNSCVVGVVRLHYESSAIVSVTNVSNETFVCVQQSLAGRNF